ncbi:calpain-5-like [Sycon ciliatum]|uniref:calpain-5-like n=1 Tax=Sycon ciliatum TaxID=27933 RepID=UPI0020ACD5F3|eukprot:scpid29704/ scgid31148/ Calpain-5; Calpain htra-3; New calpain 3
MPRVFKNQNYSKLRKQLQTSGALFEDPEFPATDKSLYTADGGPSSSQREIEWKRPKDISENPKLVTDGVSGNDLNQGDVGNCWFVAACATLAGVKPLWDKVVVNSKDQDWDGNNPGKYTGLFRFHFWRLGHWTEVVIDDRLPTSRGKLIYMHSKDPNEFWSPLLEKAYAKLAGSYQALDAGTTGDALVDFSGGVTEPLKLSDHSDSLDKRDNLFTLMEKEINRNSMMSCSISAADASEMEAKLDSGLLKGHAYGITAVKIVKISEGIFSSKKFHLVRIRNPWGQTEWNGAWSDGSDEWKNVSEKERKKLGIVFEDDGEFWMSYDDWIKHFTNFTICRIVNTSVLSVRKTWHDVTFYGEWAGARAGGCINNKETFLKNPQYVFDLHHGEDGAVMIDLMQEDRRSTRSATPPGDGTSNSNLSIGYQLFKVEENRRHRVKTLPKAAGNVTFTNSRSVFGKFELSEGRYVCVPSTFQPGITGNYMLRVFTEHASHAKELVMDQLKKPGWNCCVSSFTSIVSVTVNSVNGLPNQNLVSEGADPYCVVKVEGQTCNTPVVKDTLTARFDSSFVFFTKRPDQRPVKVEVWDKNVLKDKHLGEIELTLPKAGEGRQYTEKLRAKGDATKETQGTLSVTLEWFTDTTSR